jgi:hypothetical protein
VEGVFGFPYLIERGVSSTRSRSSGARLGYDAASISVGRCLNLTLGFLGTRLMRRFLVGSLYDVWSACWARVLLLFKVRSV